MMATSGYRTMRSSSVDGESRILCGRNYIVIPVVALVEGVRHAGGSPKPELVLAEAFGRHVETWNGRPIVVNHPVNASGHSVLASDPDILDDCYLGELLNARIDEGRLLVDAWLDVGAIKISKSDGVKGMWKRLCDGETVEVSVGAIVYTTAGDGVYQGKKYSGSWNIVIPDHLAFLDGQQIGACSVEDGCGTFRTHMSGHIKLSEGMRMAAVAALKTVKSGETVETPGVGVDAEVKTAAADCGCKPKGLVEGVGEGGLEALGHSMARTLWSADTFDMDRRRLMQRALSEHLEGQAGYVLTFNDSVVVFERYDGESYKLYQLSYSSDEKDVISLDGDPVEVVLQTKVVPAPATGGKGKSKARSAHSSNGSKVMAKAVAVQTDDEDVIGVAEAVRLNDIETVDALSKALEGTPLGRALAAHLAVASAAKQKAVTAILKSTGGKHFTAEMLNATDYAVLDKMAVTFLSQDKAAEAVRVAAAAASATEDADEEGEVDEDAALENEETADVGMQGLSLSTIDYDTEAEALLANAKSKDRRLARQGGGTVPVSAARPARVGNSGNFTARAPSQKTLRAVIPTAPEIFEFDARTGKLKE